MLSRVFAIGPENFSMFSQMQKLFFIVFLILGSAIQAVQAQGLTTEQKRSVETIIYDYLLKNPLVIRQALDSLQVQEENQKKLRQAAALQNLKAELLSNPASPITGNPKGDVTIVEFFDYNCGYCKKVLKTVKDLIILDGGVRLVFKEFPILGPSSEIAAKSALAAKKQGKYVEFHNELMRAGPINDERIKATATKLGLDLERLNKDAQDPKIQQEIMRNYQLAEELGINGTPAFIIGGELIPGAIELDQFKKIIASERLKAENIKLQ